MIIKKYFDESYYINKYPDLRNSEFKNLLEHFITYGQSELREPCDLSSINWLDYINRYKLQVNLEKAKNYFISIGINNGNIIYTFKETLKNIENKYIYDSNHNYIKFDYDYYKTINTDLLNLNKEELLQHFVNYGYNENRLFCKIPNNFDYVYYLKNNTDIINIDDEINYWKHYLYHGYFEGKTYSENHINRYLEKDNQIISSNLSSNSNYKTLIIYAYYNRPGEYKNETNMAFFINETIIKRNSEFDSLEFIFIINNYYTEVNIPNRKNVHIIKNKNCSDFEAYLIGINYIENIKNCSCTGPFTNNNFWLQPFYNKLNNKLNNIAACTTLLSVINNSYANINGPQIPGYIFIIKSKYLYLLTQRNNLFNNYKFSNTVLGRKKNKYDCIISGEHAISKVLINNKLNISGLCNQDLDYTIRDNEKYLGFNVDRYEQFKYSLNYCIFIKNNWRIDISSRDSLPVKYIETYRLIEQNSNFNFINYSIYNLDYDIINISNIGYNRYNNIVLWNSKKEFCRKFAASEEFIMFPISKCIKNIDYYYLENVKPRKYVIEGLRALLNLDYKINFYTTFNNPFDFKVPLSINVIYGNNESNKSDVNKKLSSKNIFPCSDMQTFKGELNNFCLGNSIIEYSKIGEHKNNKYLNYLNFYSLS